MTVEISPEKIPEVYLKLLITAATQIIHKTPDSYAFVRVPADNFTYLLWIGLNQDNNLEECYFVTNDVVVAPIITRPSIYLKS